jgi:23S rRNA pseudoU1915 N3-methylase RlmH
VPVTLYEEGALRYVIFLKGMGKSGVPFFNRYMSRASRDSFIISGSLGLSDQVVKRSNEQMSFQK